MFLSGYMEIFIFHLAAGHHLYSGFISFFLYMIYVVSFIKWLLTRKSACELSNISIVFIFVFKQRYIRRILLFKLWLNTTS